MQLMFVIIVIPLKLSITRPPFLLVILKKIPSSPPPDHTLVMRFMGWNEFDYWILWGQNRRVSVEPKFSR